MTTNPKLLITIVEKTTTREVAQCICDGYFTTGINHVCTYLGRETTEWDRWDVNKYDVIISAYGEIEF